jgi:hypothetical protein
MKGQSSDRPRSRLYFVCAKAQIKVFDPPERASPRVSHVNTRRCVHCMSQCTSTRIKSCIPCKLSWSVAFLTLIYILVVGQCVCCTGCCTTGSYLHACSDRSVGLVYISGG